MEKKTLRLYQYLPLVEGCHDKGAEPKEWQRRLEVMLRQKFWLSSMSNLNDPFERNFKIISNPDAVLSNEKFLKRTLVVMKQQDDPGITLDQLKQKLISPFFRPIISTINNNLISSLFSNHGVACFTSDPANLPMWAYYANKHQGYCTIIDFDFTTMCNMAGILEIDSYHEDVLSGREVYSFDYGNGVYFVFTRVRYSTTPPVMRIEELWSLSDDSYGATKYLTHNAFAVKHDQWRHEDEFRIVANINSINAGNNAFNLPDFMKIAGIIMGSQVAEAEKQVFHRLCHESKTNLYQARCSGTEYKILIDSVKEYSLCELA